MTETDDAARFPDLDEDEARRAVALIADLDALDTRPCSRCGALLCGHEAVIAIVMGFRDSPLCLTCLAAGMETTREDMRDRARAHIMRRDCFRQGWLEASRREGFGDSSEPDCLWTMSEAEKVAVQQHRATAAGQPEQPAPAAAAAAPTPDAEAGTARAGDAEWDAGDMGCGDLVLELRGRMRELAPGALLSLHATDPGAPEDIPAWCGLTGHTLVSAAHPRYLIRRKP